MPFATPPALAVCVLVVLAGALTGCDFSKPLDVPLPDYAPRITVGGFVSPGGPVTVRFGVSEGVLAPYDSAGVDALAGVVRAALFDEAGGFLDSLRYDPSDIGLYPLYRSTVVPQPGRRYELRASAPGLPDVRAVAGVPVPVLLRVRTDGVDGAGRTRLVLSWDDPPGDGVYHVALVGAGSANAGQPLSFYSPDPVLRSAFGRLDEPTDIEPDPQGGLAVFSGQAVLRDRTFDGGAHETVVLVEPDFFTGAPQRARAILSVISADYARYQQALEVQREASGNPFAEPSEAFSNVEGGLGAFVGYASSTVTDG